MASTNTTTSRDFTTHEISVGEEETSVAVGEEEEATSSTITDKSKRDKYGFEMKVTADEKEEANAFTLSSTDQVEREWKDKAQRIDAIIDGFEGKSKRVSKRDWKFMKRLCRGGVPFSQRPRVWKAVSGALDLKRNSSQSYQTLKEAASSGIEERILRQIEGDLNRTFPSHPLFQSEQGLNCLRAVLTVFAFIRPDVGYVQGLNFVAGLLIVVYGVEDEGEEDVLWTLAAIVKGKMYPNIYGDNLHGCHVAQQVLDKLVAKKFPKVWKHFQSLQCELSLATSEWLLCLFSRSFPAETVARIWDSLLFEGFKIFFRVCLAFIRLHEKEILKRNNLGDVLAYIKEEVKASTNSGRIMRRAFHGVGSMQSWLIAHYAIESEESVAEMLGEYAARKKERENKRETNEVNSNAPPATTS